LLPTLTASFQGAKAPSEPSWSWAQAARKSFSHNVSNLWDCPPRRGPQP